MAVLPRKGGVMRVASLNRGYAYFRDVMENRKGVVECARCGQEHPNLDWKVLTRSSNFGDEEAIGFANCPRLNEPILFIVADVLDLTQA